MPTRQARILILSKTYPSPSAKHVETSCVGGLEDNGNFIRLYPLPFRMLRDERQFKKWQWVDVRVEKASKDHRPESHRIYVDTIKCDLQPLSTKGDWAARREALANVPTFSDFDAIEQARQTTGQTIALLKPSRITALTITPVDKPTWTADERDKLLQQQKQGDFFDLTEEDDAQVVKLLRKLPYDFHYEYECDGPEGPKRYRHKLIDWEAGALFWKLYDEHGDGFEPLFRDRLEAFVQTRDVTFLMGTIHRFPNKWIIGSLFYPPKPQPSKQLDLF